MEKRIKKITQQIMKPNPMGFKSVDMFHHEFDFEPFLVFTEFHMDKPIFGPHPHAGISVMTYMMPESEGSFINRDSLGDYSIIEPGGIHVTQAGKGIKHDEIPSQIGKDCHGFQIWINHADKDRFVEPKAFHAFSKDIPIYENENMKLRVLQGEYENLSSPINLVTKTNLFDVSLEPYSTLELEAKKMAFIYLMDGVIELGENEIKSISMVTFEKNGTTIRIKTNSKDARFLFATGTPHNEPIIHGGPFVMTTQEQMVLTQKRLLKGEMGELNPM
jgi:quercetin 2,3-dioxygenase